jgi:flagellar basal-body rod protein FlgB
MPDKTMKLLEGMIDVAAYRQKVLTSNIANADTPGYKAKDISFQKELDKFKGVTEFKSGNRSYDVYEPVTTLPNKDGNTVNIDIEMAKVAENKLIYSTATQLMSMKIRMLKDVLKAQ